MIESIRNGPKNILSTKFASCSVTQGLRSVLNTLVSTSNKMAQIWNNLQLNNAKSIADVRASALEWYRTNLQD